MDFIKILLYAVSPKLRKAIVEFVLNLKKNPPATDNPLDKIIVGILIKIIDIKE